VECTPWISLLRNAFDEEAMVVAYYGGVVTGEPGYPFNELVVAVFDDGHDGLSGLEENE
jgi:hypothetical protein